jgi:16S rRNA (uracil1498-N3)-methyltransferase
MNRFFLSPKLIVDDRVSFPPDISHQIQHVLRLREGEMVSVLDNQGHLFRVILNSTTSEESVFGKIIAVVDADTEPKTNLALCFGLSHRDKVELILQKGTEIGVSSFQPFISSRTLVQTDYISKNKQERWERIIREAAEQSHRGRLPILETPLAFEECLVSIQEGHGLCLLAWEGAERDQVRLGDLLVEKRGDSIAVFVGPEGGFSEEETELADESGCEIITLGKRILRMETAAILLPALILHEVGEL